MMKLTLLFALALATFCCVPEVPSESSVLPYPPAEDLEYYQAQADSGYQEFWLDLKAVASAFMNNSEFWQLEISTDKMVIIAEGLFKASVEVELPDGLLILNMERQFKERGRDSIWQIISVEKQEWAAEQLK